MATSRVAYGAWVLVRIPDVPVDLYFANLEQLDEALPALQSLVGSDQRTPVIPPEDVARTEQLLEFFRPLRHAASEQASAARVRGERVFTLELDLPERAGADLEHLLNLLDRVDDLCAEQDMTWPAPIEIRAFRRSILGHLAERVREAHRPE